MAIDFERVCECLICGCREFHKYRVIKWRGENFNFVLCKICGSEIMNPRPTQEWYDVFYREEFWEAKSQYLKWKEQKEMTNDEKIMARKYKVKKKARCSDKRSKKICNIVDNNLNLSEESSILEVGAGFGHILNALKNKYGCGGFAIEPSNSAANFFEQEYGIQRIGKKLEDLECKNEIKFDLIIMSHVLENMTNPLEALKVGKQFVAENGLLYIDTSNFFYYEAENTFHPYIFNPMTLKFIVKNAGFDVLKMFCEKHPSLERAPKDKYIGILISPNNIKVRKIFYKTNINELIRYREIGLRKIK